jgi:hypothetical protein
MPKIEKSQDGWCITSGGKLIQDGMTNAQAWRALDVMQNEPVSASEVAREFKEPVAPPSDFEMQDFMSGLVHIGRGRGYSNGWAWHQFCEKFGHTPDGLHREARKPSKSVWGWVNRKAIARSKT